jgi:hypothetical protein
MFQWPRQRGPHVAAVRVRDRAKLLVLLAYLNFGITGALMRGCGSGAILEALPMPLGSTAVLFMPPAFPGPGGMPLIGTFPDPTRPAVRPNCADAAAGTASAITNARAIFVEVFDMTKLHDD